jgi:hypothetical protein
MMDKVVWNHQSSWTEKVIDPRYLCLSVEQTNFTPISLEDAKKRWEDQQ